MEIDILNNRINNLIADKDYTERQYESLKKVYNDLAESHAKQVIEIGELMKERDSIIQEKWDCINDANITIKELESELLKAKEALKAIDDNFPLSVLKDQLGEYFYKIENFVNK